MVVAFVVLVFFVVFLHNEDFLFLSCQSLDAVTAYNQLQTMPLRHWTATGR